MAKSEKKKTEKTDEEVLDKLDKVVDDDIIGDGVETITDLELEPEENPHIDDFTPSVEGGAPPVSSIQVTEEDRLKVVVSQLQIQNLELESKVIEQKHVRKVEDLNRLIADYKINYSVPDDWKLHAPTGTFNKG